MTLHLVEGDRYDVPRVANDHTKWSFTVCSMYNDKSVLFLLKSLYYFRIVNVTVCLYSSFI